MTYSDPFPRPPSAELISSAQNLHDILADSFDRPFEALGYKASFDTFLPPHSPLYSEQSQKAIESLTKEPIAKGRAWTIEIGYNPNDEKITISSLTIPFQKYDNSPHNLIFQRLNSTAYSDSYVVLESTTADSEPKLYKSEIDELEKAVFDNDTMCIVPESDVLQFAHMAGYTHPQLFTKPNDLLAHMAETFDTAYRWERTESIIVPVSEGYQLLLRRGATMEPVIASDASAPSQQKRDELFAPPVSVYHQGDGWLEVIIERVGSTRTQTVIQFDYEDHFVKLPTITTQELAAATDDTIIAKYGPDAYTVQNKVIVEVTVEMLDLLAESIMDELGDL